MGYAAQGYQSSSSRLPVKIPILICSMVLHAYLFFSALKKIRQLRVQSIIPVGCGSETEGYMTLPEHFPSIINFQNLHVKKGSVSQAHQIHALWIPSTKILILISPGKRKSYYINSWGSSMISRGLLFYADFTLTRKKGGKVHFFEKP